MPNGTVDSLTVLMSRYLLLPSYLIEYASSPIDELKPNRDLRLIRQAPAQTGLSPAEHMDAVESKLDQPAGVLSRSHDASWRLSCPKFRRCRRISPPPDRGVRAVAGLRPAIVERSAEVFICHPFSLLLLAGRGLNWL